MFLKRGFTLVEIMIVFAIIGILAAAMFPFASIYLSRSRDVTRITDIRLLSDVFQTYRTVNEVYPSNATGALFNYCTTDILWWKNGIGKDRQYEELGMNFSLVPQEKVLKIPTDPCSLTGSYIYSRLIDAAGLQYAIIAARMETNGTVTYFTGTDFTGSTHLLEIMQAKPMKGIDITTIPANLAPIYHVILY